MFLLPAWFLGNFVLEFVCVEELLGQRIRGVSFSFAAISGRVGVPIFFFS